METETKIEKKAVAAEMAEVAVEFDSPAQLTYPFFTFILVLLLIPMGAVVAFVQFAHAEAPLFFKNPPMYSDTVDKDYWQILRRAYLRGEPTTLFLNEKHLNDWAVGAFSKDWHVTKKSTFFDMWPDSPRFKLQLSALWVLVPIHISVLGSEKTFMLHAKGTFRSQKVGDRKLFQFCTNELSLGAAALPSNSWIQDIFMGMVIPIFYATKEYKELYPVWQRLTDVSVMGDRISISQPPKS